MRNTVEREESKVVFNNGDRNSVYYGNIIKEDDYFIYLENKEKSFRLNKKYVIRIVGVPNGKS